MRKTMTKEVTQTTVKLGKMEVVDGKPEAVELEPEILLGNVSQEKAQRQMNKKYGVGVTVFEVQPDTKRYQMAVEKFIELAEEVPVEDQE